MAIEVSFGVLDKPQRLRCRIGRYGEPLSAGKIQRAARRVHYYAFSRGALYGSKRLKPPLIPLTPERLAIGWAIHQVNR